MQQKITMQTMVTNIQKFDKIELVNILLLGDDIDLKTYIHYNFPDRLRNPNDFIQINHWIDGRHMEEFKPDLIVSFGYRFKIKPEVFNYPKLGAWNIHISYLPYNKGADPNIWSHLEGTPSGVTIHLIDEGFDTGPILTQKLVPLKNDSDLESSYFKLKQEARRLFQDVFQTIVEGGYMLYQQNADGTCHVTKNRPALQNGWHTKLGDLRYLFTDVGSL